MFRKTAIYAIVTTLVGSISAGMAAEAPSLTGTWKGSAAGVHVGATPYRKDKSAINFGEEIEIVLVITEQHGQNFAGTITALGKTETIIGSIHAGNNSGVMLDDDGEVSFTLSDNNSIDRCYWHIYKESKVTACSTLKRVE